MLYYFTHENHTVTSAEARLDSGSILFAAIPRLRRPLALKGLKR